MKSGTGITGDGKVSLYTRLFRYGSCIVSEKTVPDLVLLDLMLPGLSEEKLLKKIDPVQVIVISSITCVVHDIRTPLSAISSYVQLMEETETNKKGTRYLPMPVS